MSSNSPFVPVDADGWPILDDAISSSSSSGWTASSASESGWMRALEPLDDQARVTPEHVSEFDPLDGFVFPKRRRRFPVIPLVVALLAIGLGATAWSLTHRRGVAVASIRPGNCLSLPGSPDALPGQQITRFSRVECSLPHNAEVFATPKFDTSAPFPGQEALTRTSTTVCQAGVPPAIRTHPDAINWNIVFFGPISADTYHRGETATLLCVVSFPSNVSVALHG